MSASACQWCSGPIVDTRRPGSMPPLAYCGRKCRQTAFRLRRRREIAATAGARMRFAYADPPYPGLSRRYYGSEPSYAGEVDHAALIASLEASGFDGWALSTSAKALRFVLPMCPASVRVCAWVKPSGTPTASNGIHNKWEPLLVNRGRQLPPGRCDWLRAQPARFGGTLMGRKPLAFVVWMFELLGVLPGDELVDLFPGTGVVGRAFASLYGSKPSEYSDDGGESARGVAELGEVDVHARDVDGALDPRDRADEPTS